MTKEEILSAIESMTVLDLADLVKMIEEKFGVSAAAPAAVAEVKTEFDVILKTVGEKKIEVIKVVREITGLGLKESKDVVDGAPKPVKEHIPEKEAGEIKAKLEAAGATVEIK